MKKTNYAVAVCFDERDIPDDTILLGWNNRYDWFDTDYTLNDALDDDGNLPDTEFGLLNVSKDTALYVGETADDVKGYADSANKEGIEAVVVKIEITEDEIKIIPQE
jgi:hypothetical protein